MIGQDEGRPMAEARILNVNHDPNDRERITRVLREAGFQVLEADSGRQALELAGQTIDLVILEVELPDIDGFEVARRVRANPETRLLPVLHLAAQLTGPESRALGLQSGADGYVTQPTEPVELLATVRAVLRARRAERELRDTLERNSVILTNIADAVTAQNAAGKVIYA